MTTTRIPRDGLAGPRELARRLRNQRASIGRQIAELRTEAGVSRSELAQASGIDHSHLWRIESGLATPSLHVLVAISACLGCDLGVRLFPGIGPRLHDRFQAPMIEALLRGLHRRWMATPEFPVPDARGVIDVVLRSPADGLVIACECHSELRRLEHVLRRAAEKAATLRSLERPDTHVSTLLLLRSTRETRAVARRYESTLAAAYPARSADALTSLLDEGSWPGPAVVWVRLEAGRAALIEGTPRLVRLGR